MKVEDAFLETWLPRLKTSIASYLDGRLAHANAREFAWSVIEAWEGLSIPDKLPSSTTESAFWAAVWSLQYLANEEHWSEGVTQRQLHIIQVELEGNAKAPISSRRP